jgi:hypothetical protein
MNLEALQYPIGRATIPENPDPELISGWVQNIKELPAALHEATTGLTDEQLDTPYRPGGWTIRQVVHHLADSHMNSFIRFKLALTEENPTIKPYDEGRWAELPDTTVFPIDSSLLLLAGLHDRWTVLLSGLSADDLERTFFHPENKTTNSLKRVIGIYSWHGLHHLAHITQLRERSGW